MEEEYPKLDNSDYDTNKAKEEIKESFSHMPDIQSKILSNLDAHERLLLEFI